MKLVEHVRIPSKPLATKGAVAQAYNPTFKDTSIYVVEACNLDTEDLSDFSALAKERGLAGDYTFSSPSVAKLYHRYLRFAGGRLKEGESGFLNAVLTPAGTTTEGSGQLSPGLTFFFTGQNDSINYNKFSSDYNSSSMQIWDLSTASGVPVAIIDSGGFISSGNTTGNESYNASWAGDWGTYYSYNFVNNTGSILDVDPTGIWHGRGVASLAFSKPNDQAGTVGAASHAIPYCLVATTDAQYAAALESCLSWGVKVANISDTLVDTSVNHDGSAYAEYGATQDFTLGGGTLLAASGNNGDQYTYPAGYTQYNTAIAVSSFNAIDGGASYFYSTGNHANTTFVDVWAPGGGGNYANPTSAGNGYDIPAGGKPTQSQSIYNLAQGTSVSCPIVTGVVACLYAQGRVSSVLTTKSWLSASGHSRWTLSGKPELDAYYLLR